VRVSVIMMTRYLVLAVALAACGKKADPGHGSGSNVGSNPGSGSGVGSGSANVANNLPAEGDPTPAVVNRAFHGAKPVFPLLSKDGNTAMFELSRPVGMSVATTYAIGFTSNGSDAWSGVDEPGLESLVDGMLVSLLLDAMDRGTAPTIDLDTMSKAATRITDRIADDGYTPFEHAIGEVGVNDVIPAGPFELRVTEATGAITIAITDTSGAAVATDKVDPVAMGQVSGIDCTALPRLRKAWFDTARKRLLLQVRWHAGPDQCDRPDDKFRLFGLP